jgi:hypothetical protein
VAGPDDLDETALQSLEPGWAGAGLPSASSFRAAALPRAVAALRESGPPVMLRQSSKMKALRFDVDDLEEEMLQL